MERKVPRKRPRPAWDQKGVAPAIEDDVDIDDETAPGDALEGPVQESKPPPADTLTIDTDARGSSIKNSSLGTTGTEASPTLTPHTLRLLKLIEEGSADHAKMAASHLTALTKDSPPLVLWEILGRLQAFLVSPAWNTRSNAGLAMEGVAQHLPQADQDAFLNDGLPSCFTAKSSNMWLDLPSLIQDNLMTAVILDKGQVLVGSAESRFQVEEEEEQIEHFDRSQQDATNFCELRLEMQRHIMARRLGLSGLGRFQGDWLTGELANDLEILDAPTDSFLPTSGDMRQPTRKRPVRKRTKGTDPRSESHMSIRALLTLQIQQQQQKQHGTFQPHQCDEDVDDDLQLGSMRVSHRTSQSLLAGELVYRMFDSSWHVRHGSLIGILALIRAWKAHRRHSEDTFGVWPHDILARCLCVLALDRFGDFSGVSAEAFSNGVVAPVREMAGQVFSVVFLMSPQVLQRQALTLICQLLQYQEWEVRHGALIALKYVVALMRTTSDMDQEWQHVLIAKVNDLAIATLEDENDDVQSVTAQLLGLSLGEDYPVPSCDQPDNNVLIRVARSLWKSLSNVRLVSSSIQDLVSLFSTIICTNADIVLPVPSTQNSALNGLVQILWRLNELLECDYISVKITIVRIVGTLTPRLAGLLVNRKEDVKVEDNDINSARDWYCRIVEIIYSIYCEYSLSHEDGSNSDLITLLAITEKAWMVLSTFSNSILKGSASCQIDLEKHLLLQYFTLKDLSCIKLKTLTEASSENRLRVRLNQSRIIAQFLILGGEDYLRVRHDVVELCVFACVNSPFFYQCEAACFLIAAFDQANDQSRLSCPAHLKGTIEFSHAMVEQRLHSMMFSTYVEGFEQSVASITSKIVEAFSDCLDKVTARKVSGRTAATTVVEHWRKIAIADSTSTIPVTMDWMRKSTVLAGTLTSGDNFLPKTLTPVVRPLMTSIQNEHDEACQRLTCSFTVRLLGRLSSSVPADKAEGYKKTFSKVLGNLCNMVASNAEPGSSASSQVVGLLVNELPGPSLCDLEPVYIRLVTLNDTSTIGPMESKRSALLILEAACCCLCRGRAITYGILKDFVPQLIYLCVEGDHDLRSLALRIVKGLCAVDEASVLEWAIPILVSPLRDSEHNGSRKSACEALRDILNSTKTATTLCPFVRLLLPISMTLMTDSVRSCAEIGAKVFSRLVHVAPLVKERAASTIEKDANLVIDHLIHGKKIPDCRISAPVAQALRDAGITLRNYQMEGISWLRFLQSVKLNGALCDSMGLGKTLQALVAVALLHDDGNKNPQNDPKNVPPSLVVCPSSVVGHWMNEIKKFFPRGQIFRAVALVGTPSQRKETMKAILTSFNLVVTNYAVLRSDVEAISTVNWSYCVLDEGHLLRNPKTATARASRRLQSRHRLILTGTPVQNKVNEVWATFDFLMPNFLGSSTEFAKEFARPISKGHNGEANAADIAFGMEKLKLLHQQVLPFILRREKEEVLKELPPKIITRIPCFMSSVQKRLYHQFCTSEQGQRSLSVLHQAMTGDLTGTNELSSFSSEVLKSLLYLRLLCTHPYLVKMQSVSSSPVDAAMYDISASGKLLALKELLRDAGIYSQELSAADNDSSLLYCDSVEDADASELNEILEPSMSGIGKFRTQDGTELNGSRCLIFAQFKHSLDIVEELLLKPHMPSVHYLRLDGKVPASKRSEIVDTFNYDDRFKILLLTTRVGGLGLNLTGADTVIFLEHDWNPHSDIQAMDRAHRIGQKKTVHVYQLVTVNSIEEKTMVLHEKKLAMSAAIVNTENSSMYSMGTDRLLDIFQYRSEVSKGANGQSSDLENALDALVERYEYEYESLSLHDFISGLDGRKCDKETLPG